MNSKQNIIISLLCFALITQTAASAKSSRNNQVLVPGNKYQTYNQWGGSFAPWHDGGVFVIGGRNGQRIISVKISSANGGKTFDGVVQYQNEGPIGFRGLRKAQNRYSCLVQWGGVSAPWHIDGLWVLGARKTQSLVNVNISSVDGGKTFAGTITYKNEGPIGFKAKLIA